MAFNSEKLWSTPLNALNICRANISWNYRHPVSPLDKLHHSWMSWGLFWPSFTKYAVGPNKCDSLISKSAQRKSKLHHCWYILLGAFALWLTNDYYLCTKPCGIWFDMSYNTILFTFYSIIGGDANTQCNLLIDLLLAVTLISSLIMELIQHFSMKCKALSLQSMLVVN